ncbi:DUF3313 domain-containing protein [Collimonas sp.]|jgi:hypothetical protein|uniref:DUF3313 domain-containing protein n=1 Tax=Collimonas sp. TaxID=1963772 RepID=UPI002BA0A65F|nr:DUF3313 domain-containing protein [Collimonas sp.]HWW06235.1 DUF3313 domain-containing protein [Collimonas sp.]
MHISIKASRLVLAAIFCVALAACGTTQPIAYSGIASSSKLTPNPKDDTGRIPYSYSTPVEWRKYNAIIIDPVTVYRGPDQQFGDMSETDKAALAGYMQTQFTEKLRPRFAPGSNPAPNTLRVKLTLTGAGTNTAVASTVTRFDLAGMPYNVVQSIRGKEGVFMGSVSYSVEIYDSTSNQLLKAFVTKQYPNAMNIAATFGSLHAAKTGIDKGADALVADLK